ncbi:MAG: ABC transporter ATP-binding protein [Lachnospiraceae bacterium]|nr:ABC transporter ATP-binding protein [Lachnospiraceae bacterium]
MIEVKNLTKCFDEVTAVNHVSAEIKDRAVFGLVGTNGAGKSTLLRLLTGILKPEEGEIKIDGKGVYENVEVKRDLFYISDDQFYFPNDTPKDIMQFYRGYYPGFDTGRFLKLIAGFGLDENRKIRTFSKGMKKQLFVALGLSSGTRYLLCDETFDGLDPVMRQAVKSLLAKDMEERGLTSIIASHNLRELEDICDHVGLLHQGGILFSRDLDDMKLGIHKLQCVFKDGELPESLSELDVVLSSRVGSIHTLTVRGSEEEILAKMRQTEAVFFELVPLSLEEIFICETEVRGYDIKKIVI